ncbi:MAG TPA: DUF3052 domain-containing protein [Myxococcaceae bacterium]|nr:DUF3052 domain-containing protein [Myxococcaceae bacterium]
MTEYALAPLATALGIRSGSKVSIINPPAGFVQRLNPLPEGVEFLITARTGLDVILFFAERPDQLVARLPGLSRAMSVNGGLWICWARKEPALLSEAFIRQAALEIGLVDDKHCDLDDGWSGLRLVWKPRARPVKPRARKSPPPAHA